MLLHSSASRFSREGGQEGRVEVCMQGRHEDTCVTSREALHRADGPGDTAKHEQTGGVQTLFYFQP